MSERTLNAVQAALLVVAAFFFGLSAGKWYVEQTNYRAGYAAAVDSVRAVERKATRPHLVDLSDVPYLVYVDRDSIVRVLRFGGHK